MTIFSDPSIPELVLLDAGGPVLLDLEDLVLVDIGESLILDDGEAYCFFCCQGSDKTCIQK